MEILITPEGRTSVQTRGFSGSSCREASKFLEQALGQPTSERLTAEFHEVQSAQQAGRVQA